MLHIFLSTKSHEYDILKMFQTVIHKKNHGLVFPQNTANQSPNTRGIHQNMPAVYHRNFSTSISSYYIAVLVRNTLAISFLT